MQKTDVLSLEESNIIIENLLDSNKPFSICRVGNGESIIALDVLNNRQSSQQRLYELDNNAGIYYSTKQHVELFAKHYNNAVLQADALACFDIIYTVQQNEYLWRSPKPSLHFEVLEPYYAIEKGIVPWSHKLIGKKILVVSPFVETFKKQVASGFHFYGPDAPDEKRMFHKDQAFVFYKTYSTLGGNHIHNNWYQTFGIMCSDIKQLDFDIALVSCGGYGLPLCNYIKSLGKSAIYVGGALQLLFGVNGQRWANHPVISRVSSAPNNQWTWPADSETIKTNRKIEGGCYWK